MTSIVKYSGFTNDALEEMEKEVDAISGGLYFDLETGDNIIRVLPTLPGKQSPFRVTAQHYIDAVPGMERMAVFACPRVELKQPCIACQKVEELQRTGNPVDRDRAYRMSAGLRVFANVINRRNPDAGVKVLGFGKSIWEQMKAIRKNVRLGGDFTDPSESGFDLVITRTGEERKTKYMVSADRNSSPLAATAEGIDAIMAIANDLDAVINVEPPDELLAAWGQSLRQQSSPRAAVQAQRPQAALPDRSSTITVAPRAPRAGASVMAHARGGAPATTAVDDAADESWLDG